MSPFPVLVRTSSPAGETRFGLGDPLVDSYLEFVAGRARPNTLRAVAFDLKTFFTVVGKDPVAVVPADVFEFLADQRGDRTVVRLSDGESGLSARTIARRLSSVSGFYAYLVARATPRSRRTRCRRGSPPAGVAVGPDGAAGAGAPDAAEDPLARRGRRVGRCDAHPPRPGDGLRHGAGRPASLRGTRAAAVRHPGGRTVGVRRRGQGRPPAGGAHLQRLLRRAGRVPGQRASEGRLDRRGVRDPEGPEPGPGAERPRGGDRSS